MTRRLHDHCHEARRRECRPNRPPRARQRMSGAMFVAGAVIGLVGNALHPHSAEPNAAATIQALAQYGAWVMFTSSIRVVSVARQY